MNYQKLFDHMAENHGVTLLESDMQEICNIVEEMQTESKTTFNMKPILTILAILFAISGIYFMCWCQDMDGKYLAACGLICLIIRNTWKR